MSFQMCLRINNLHNLNVALEDIQQKISALLKMEIITVEQSAKSKEYPKGKRNGIFFVGLSWENIFPSYALCFPFFIWRNIVIIFCLNSVSVMQPWIFQGRGSFLKQWHFYKQFTHNMKESPAWKYFSVFLPETLKIAF